MIVVVVVLLVGIVVGWRSRIATARSHDHVRVVVIV